MFINSHNLSAFMTTNNFDDTLLKTLEKECFKEKAKKKKKKSAIGLRKEKRLMYYGGWGKDKSVK